MVSDLIYFCRIKGDEEWTKFDEHPCRPLEGVASLWAKSQGIDYEVTIEVSQSPELKPHEFYFKPKYNN